MAVPVEEAIAALSTFSLEDEQPEVQGPGVWVSTERGATESPIEYSDVAAYRLSLSEDTEALNQLDALTQEGKFLLIIGSQSQSEDIKYVINMINEEILSKGKGLLCMHEVVRYNYSAEERKALVELVSYVKSVGSMMQRCDTLVADALWETIHAEVQI